MILLMMGKRQRDEEIFQRPVGTPGCSGCAEIVCLGGQEPSRARLNQSWPAGESAKVCWATHINEKITAVRKRRRHVFGCCNRRCSLAILQSCHRRPHSGVIRRYEDMPCMEDIPGTCRRLGIPFPSAGTHTDTHARGGTIHQDWISGLMDQTPASASMIGQLSSIKSSSQLNIGSPGSPPLPARALSLH